MIDPVTPARLHPDEVPNAIRRMVGAWRPVLVVRQPGDELLLPDFGAEGTAVEPSGLPAAGASTFAAIVIGEAALARDDAAEWLAQLKPLLATGGFLIAAVPGRAHASDRLAYLAGSAPVGAPRTTRAAVVATLGRAGFAVGRLERLETAVEVPSALDAAWTAATDLRRQVLADPDALTRAFVLAAYPLPWPGMTWMKEHLERALAERDTARRELADARFDVDGVERHIATLLDAAEASVKRERALRAELLALHSRLAQRDQEHISFAWGETEGTSARRLKVFLRYTWLGELYVTLRRRLTGASKG